MHDIQHHDLYNNNSSSSSDILPVLCAPKICTHTHTHVVTIKVRTYTFHLHRKLWSLLLKPFSQTKCKFNAWKSTNGVNKSKLLFERFYTL